MKINFTSFLVTEALIYAALVIALVDSCVRITKGSITISQALIVLMLSYSYFSSAQQLMSASHSALTAISAAGKVEEILDTDTTRPFDRHCRKIRNILMGSVWNMYPMVMKDGPEPYRMFLLQSPKVLLSL